MDTFSKAYEIFKVEVDEMHAVMKSLLIDFENTSKTIATEKKIHNLSDLCKNYFLNLNISDENFEIIDSKLALDVINTISTTGELKNIEDFELKSKVFLVANQPINKVKDKLFLANSKNLILNYKFLLLKEENDTLKSTITKRTWGSGINLQLELSSKEKNIPISSLLELAKNKKIEKRYTISEIGMEIDSIKTINNSGEFTIENYPKIISKIDSIIQNITENTSFNPELIKINSNQ